MPPAPSASRRSLARTFAVALVAATLVSGQAGADATGDDRYGFAPGYTLLWESSADLARDLDGMVGAGARWIRVDFDWPSVQPTPTTWRWSAIDRVVSAARSRGLQVLALPAYTPSWARPAGTDDKHPPTDPATYAAFVGAAAARYAPQGVRHWEIWNEPNIVQFWKPAPNVADYTALLVRAAASIRAVDAGATILTGGTAPATDGTDISPTRFVAGIYANGGGAAFDAVAHHPYHYPYAADAAGSWNALAAVTPALRDLLVANGDAGMQIWATEYGAPTGTSATAVSEAAQASLIHDGIRLWNSWSYTGPLLLYAYRDRGTNPADREQNFGLVRHDFSPKPALAMFTQVTGGSSAAAPSVPSTSTTTTTTVPPPGGGAQVHLAWCVQAGGTPVSEPSAVARCAGTG